MTFEEILSKLEDYDFEEFNKENLPDIEDLFIEDKDILIESGMTKLVINDLSLPFVIKIPYMGLWDYVGEEDYGDEPSRKEEPSAYYWCPFGGANFNDVSLSEWDYCEAEAAMYQEIKRHENSYIVDFFMETKRVSTFTTYPLYIQDKCKPSYKDFTVQETRITQNICKQVNVKNTYDMQWLTEVRETAGEEILIELLNVLRAYDIRDLHGDNVGYNSYTGALAIFDYSSYFD